MDHEGAADDWGGEIEDGDGAEEGDGGTGDPEGGAIGFGPAFDLVARHASEGDLRVVFAAAEEAIDGVEEDHACAEEERADDVDGEHDEIDGDHEDEDFDRDDEAVADGGASRWAEFRVVAVFDAVGDAVEEDGLEDAEN